MNKKFQVLILVIIAGLIFVIIGNYFAWFADLSQNLQKSVQPSKPADSPTSVPYRLELIADNLFVPWSIVFTSADRLLVTERNGSLRVIEKNQLQAEPLATFSVSKRSEEGLMGLALDPDYHKTHRVFACLAYEDGASLYDKVVSFIDEGNNISNLNTVIDNIPAAQYHAGCRLLFLPDKTLLITTGDATQATLAQNLESKAGKILRINRDGSIPRDNPFSNSVVWTYGHRNPQGLAWDSAHNLLWSSEHGPSIFDGPAGGDEVNVIDKGKNYGWPTIHHRQTKEGLESPTLEFTPAIAPAALLYYTGSIFPQLTNKLLMATLKGEALYALTIDPKDSTKISHYEKLPDIDIGRLREIVQAPDGSIYITTSNQDGRGDVRKNDDKIYRLVPK